MQSQLLKQDCRQSESINHDYGQKLLNRVGELEAMEGIQRGVADLQAGRVTPLREFESEFRAKRGLPSRAR